MASDTPIDLSLYLTALNGEQNDDPVPLEADVVFGSRGFTIHIRKKDKAVNEHSLYVPYEMRFLGRCAAEYVGRAETITSAIRGSYR